MKDEQVHVPIKSAADIVAARQKGRALAQELGFNRLDLTLIWVQAGISTTAGLVICVSF